MEYSTIPGKRWKGIFVIPFLFFPFMFISSPTAASEIVSIKNSTIVAVGVHEIWGGLLGNQSMGAWCSIHFVERSGGKDISYGPRRWQCATRELSNLRMLNLAVLAASTQKPVTVMLSSDGSVVSIENE